jgi:excisionase family DNA binding protein
MILLNTVISKEEFVEKLLLRPAEVAELIALGRSKTYELIASGLIPSIRVGRAVRVPADALRLWVKGIKEPSKTT